MAVKRRGWNLGVVLFWRTPPLPALSFSLKNGIVLGAPLQTGRSPGCGIAPGAGVLKRMNDTGFLRPLLEGIFPALYVSSWWWSAVGFAGNIMFGSRFIFQWLESERRRCLVVPAHFWHLSFWGSVLNLIYALHLDSAPLLLGVAALPFIYGRNLVLLKRSPEGVASVERPARKGRLTPVQA